MKITIYRYSDSDIETTVGMHPNYGLEDQACGSLDFCDPIEVELPEGYGLVECNDGMEHIQDPDGNVCTLVACLDHGFWVFPRTGGGCGMGLYVHVDKHIEPVWDGAKFATYTATVKDEQDAARREAS